MQGVADVTSLSDLAEMRRELPVAITGSADNGIESYYELRIVCFPSHRRTTDLLHDLGAH
jgi:hypothetical protein